MDDSALVERPSEIRVKEALGLEVGRFVVACPKDLTMFSDAVKTTDADDRLVVSDIISLIEEAVLWPTEPGIVTASL
jgi:Fe-S oxidoreductase